MNPYVYDAYFDWLCDTVNAGSNGAFWPYRNLLRRLFLTPFEPSRYMDDNREVDGRMLRYYFESNHDDYVLHEQSPYHVDGGFYESTKNEPCSMLEMMIALAKKIDTSYLYSNESRLFIWFWVMIESMGLADNIDGYWENDTEKNDLVDWIIRTFNLNAHYSDENGNWIPTVFLFPIHNMESISRASSLWEQMQVWYGEQRPFFEDISPEEFTNYYISTHMYG